MSLTLVIWLDHHPDNQHRIQFTSLEVGLLSRFPPFLYFPNFSTSRKYMLAIEYHVHIWQVSLQLSCGDTCQIWMRCKECKWYFCQIENVLMEKLTNGALVTQECMLMREKWNRYNRNDCNCGCSCLITIFYMKIMLKPYPGMGITYGLLMITIWHNILDPTWSAWSVIPRLWWIGFMMKIEPVTVINMSLVLEILWAYSP